MTKSINEILDIDTTTLEQKVISDNEIAIKEQQKRYDLLDKYINAIGKEKISAVYINGRKHTWRKK